MTVLLHPLPVAHLLDRVHRARLHVVLEAKRVTHFVGNDVANQLAHEIVRKRKPLRTRIERSDLDEVPVLHQVLYVVIELDVGLEDLARAGIVDVGAGAFSVVDGSQRITE